MKFKMGGSGIHIKPENKGKFTATKKATGKSTEELTHSKNPVTKKRAIFAQNAAKWKHDDGSKKLFANEKASPDSTKYYEKEMTRFMDKRDSSPRNKSGEFDVKANKAMSNMFRQTKKGKEGFDADGHPLKKMQNGSKNTKSFPDLNKDGKVSRADVLVGRGVIPVKKMAMGSKSTKSFPDLNKDGKITQADILKGRGVIKKTGAKSMNVDEKMCGSKGMKYAEGTKSINFKKKEMIKRADGSYSQRGLYDNIRANKGSGKKPTPEMLKQEKKIKASK